MCGGFRLKAHCFLLPYKFVVTDNAMEGWFDFSFSSLTEFLYFEFAAYIFFSRILKRICVRVTYSVHFKNSGWA